MTASSPPSPAADPFDPTSLPLAELGALWTPALADAVERTLAAAACGEPAEAVQEQADVLRDHHG
ncbi:hypothetical protein [Saccharothrix syringae]|uniref:hypothetical protein n=1 Tax=Saccharothrix syringae TaxID=103733 RepID=UPI0005263EC8|nr:hypothetical protein [Saccharothrix syringae]